MSDSDTDQKKPGLPKWQLEKKDATPATQQKPNPEIEPAVEERSTVIEQAKKFLEEDEVRDASTNKKVAFLESKGLKADEIQELLGVARNPEASAQIQVPVQTPSSQLPPASTPQKAPMLQNTSSPQSQLSSPPIITYPEFLITPQSPTPLITRRRLLATLYIFSGLSALLYGTDTYLIKPMLHSLTKSRLDLASATKTKLQVLIEKLESAVSEIPYAVATGKMETEAEDSDEDPTEMFHRDIGVQTSFPSSPHSSRPATPTPTTSPLDVQKSRLQTLKSHLSGLVEDSTSEGQDVSDLENTITVLREYLEGMAYVSSSYVFGGAGGYGGNKDADDEISKVKASIRGVKGVLLSARSFPGGARSGR